MLRDDAPTVDSQHLPAFPLALPQLPLAPLSPFAGHLKPALQNSVIALLGKPARRRDKSRSMASRLQPLIVEELAHGRLFLGVPILLGIGIVLWFAAPFEPSGWLGWLSLPLVVAARQTAHRGHAAAALVFAVIGLLVAGMGLAALETWRQSTQVLDAAVTTTIEGVVERREAAGEGRWRYVVRLTATRDPQLMRPPGRIAVLARGQATSSPPGTVISGRTRLSPPSGPALPGLTDFGFAAFFDGVGAVGYFYGKPQMQGLAEDLTLAQRAEMALYSLRGAVGDRIRGYVAGDPGAFAAAIVTDERRAISTEAVTALRMAGLAHIVAISGLNMALAAGICFVGLRILLSLSPTLAQALPTKKIAAAGALLLVTLYYVISGFGVSAERAYLMMAIMLTAVFFDRPSISLHNIALSAIAIMVLSPSAVLGPSFQMSFAATAALVAGYASWTARRASRDTRVPATNAGPVRRALGSFRTVVSGTFMTSLIGGLSTAIFSASHFHQLTGYGLAANLAAMPVISLVVMPAGLMGMLAMPFGLDEPLFALMGFGSRLVIAIATEVASWGGNAVTGRLPPWFLVVATGGLLLLVLLRTRLALIGLLPLGASLLMVGFTQPTMHRPDLLISEDGALVASLSGTTAAINRPKPPAFVYRQWESALRLDAVSSPERREPPVTTAALDKGDPTADLKPDHAAGETSRSALPSEMLSGPGAIQDSQGEPQRPAANPADRKPRDGKPPAEKPQQLTGTQVIAAGKLMRETLANAEAGRFVCLGARICLLRSVIGVRIAWIDDARYAGPACDAADIVIAPRARFDTCRSAALMLNGNSLRRIGAVEIDFAGSQTHERWQLHAAMVSARRPWSEHRAYDWRTRSMDERLPERLQRMISGSDG